MAARAVVRAGGFLRTLNYQVVPKRNVRYTTFIDTVGPPKEYEVFANPPEWRFVERLEFPKTVPHPKPKAEYPSGWRPRSANPDTSKYDVLRTKNAMLPLYLVKKHLVAPRMTKVQRVRGDVNALKKDLVEYASRMTGKLVPAQANEVYNEVVLRGDFYYHARDFLLSKGF